MIRKDQEVKYLSPEQTKLFFAATKRHPRDNLFFLFSYLYGLRVSEATNIKLTDILPDLRTPKELYIRRLKRGISRHYPIRSSDTHLLKRYLRQRAKLPNAAGNPFLFITAWNSASGHMTVENVNKILQKYSKTIPLPRDKMHSHTFRHSCAIHMLLKGADIYDVSSHLGHTSVLTTISYYGRFSHRDWIAKTNDRLENKFFV